jgi:hypothetical protein
MAIPPFGDYSLEIPFDLAVTVDRDIISLHPLKQMKQLSLKAMM